MNSLITVIQHPIKGVGQSCVNARDLWAFFRPRNPFANWICNKLLQHQRFTEDTDYVREKVLREIAYGGHTRVSHQVDVIVTVAMAEAIAEVEFCRGPVPWN